ncbi:2Fe-2S iron-sulfur cluster binding domain-containing protein [Candidatus Methylospira mobilis]|uniref:2Fe-2S iron-sulfur cluster binding domain-containing protein n=1 Tax=Candidatus Methylospira mobilis TaxID=1808979 RepID=A0A5Q0BHK6_9GAMM|nr:2Fe-2S iron-sulfur cluster binding domain-containing protein [Candidatus Methylospira mobilis]
MKTIARNDAYPFILKAVKPLADDVVQLSLSTKNGEPFSYREGQFLSLRLSSGVQRSYSMASACSDDGQVQLHVRLLDGGQFSEWLRGQSRVGESLQVLGPYGDCVWQQPESASATVLMLATGTGIAPLKALIEKALSDGVRNPLILYWGGNTEKDLYLKDYFFELAGSHSNFAFVPVLTGAQPDWQGRHGFVQDAAAGDFPDLGSATVYACGSPAMVEAARTLLISTRNLDSTRFKADAFCPAIPRKAIHDAAHISIKVKQQNGMRSSLSVPSGISLLQALTSIDQVIGVCGGQAACGNCRVVIPDPWKSNIAPAGRKEARLLAAIDSAPEHRLACQIQVNSSLEGLLLDL